MIGSLNGDFLPMQVIYKGKTTISHPQFSVIHQTTDLQRRQCCNIIGAIIIPYLEKLRESLYDAPTLIIREYGSTLYVGLARAVSTTYTNFRLTFLLTRLQEALYEDLAV